MSSTAVEAIVALQFNFIENCCLAVSCTLFAYERCMLWDQEVELIWRRKMSLATAVYALMHVSILTLLWTSTALAIVMGCNSGFVLAVTEISSSILFRWTIGAISALRVYAINGRKLGMPIVIISLFLVYTSYDFYNACSMFKLPAPPPVGCLILSNIRADVQHGLKDVGLACAVVAEVLVLVATWRATYKTRKAIRDISSIMRAPVSRMLFRDGTIYFGVIVSLLIIDAVLELTVTDVSLTGIAYVLQATCVSHLYLNLRQAAGVSYNVHMSTSCIHDSTPSLVVGSLDGSLVFASDTYVDEDADVESASGEDVEQADSEGIEMTTIASSRVGVSFDLSGEVAQTLEASHSQC